MHEERSPLLAANWKQNLTWSEIESYAARLRDLLPQYFTIDTTGSKQGDDVEPAPEIVLCAPYPYIELLGRLLDDARIYLGAQDVSSFSGGAHTGEVSAAMLNDLGCDYCIVGHSERRWQMGEDDGKIAQKLTQLTSEAIVPILCVGEQLAERESGAAVDRTLGQLSAVMPHLHDLPEVVIAYEPVWAIGTGYNASPADAQRMAEAIRGWLSRTLGQGRADATLILYGGSVKDENVADYLQVSDMDGVLVGGASLKPEGLAGMQAAMSSVCQSSERK